MNDNLTPEPLRLAKLLAQRTELTVIDFQAAECLRRLHETNQEMLEALEECHEAIKIAAKTFRAYERHHLVTGSENKAASNRALALDMETALAKAKGEA